MPNGIHPRSCCPLSPWCVPAHPRSWSPPSSSNPSSDPADPRSRRPARQSRRLLRLVARGKVTRILHYGDSPTTADSITSDIRRLLQKRFGDAGHGFLLIAKPWAWYGHDGIRLDANGWEIQPASQKRAPDGIHGLGGVSFIGSEGATSRVGLPDDQSTGAVVYYLAQPV